jgi:hypothetical protein
MQSTFVENCFFKYIYIHEDLKKIFLMVCCEIEKCQETQDYHPLCAKLNEIGIRGRKIRSVFKLTLSHGYLHYDIT